MLNVSPFKKFLGNEFRRDLRTIDWYCFLKFTDLDSICKVFNSNAKTVAENHAPFINYNVNLTLFLRHPADCIVIFDLRTKDLISDIVYQFSCGGCNATYIGQSKRHLKVRISNTSAFLLSLVKNHLLAHLLQQSGNTCYSVTTEFVVRIVVYFATLRILFYLNSKNLFLFYEITRYRTKRYGLLRCSYINNYSLLYDIYIYNYSLLYRIYPIFGNFYNITQSFRFARFFCILL